MTADHWLILFDCVDRMIFHSLCVFMFKESVDVIVSFYLLVLVFIP